MSDSSRPHGLQPTRLLRPWEFPGNSTGVGCHCLLWGVHLPKSKCYVRRFQEHSTILLTWITCNVQAVFLDVGYFSKKVKITLRKKFTLQKNTAITAAHTCWFPWAVEQLLRKMWIKPLTLMPWISDFSKHENHLEILLKCKFPRLPPNLLLVKL